MSVSNNNYYSESRQNVPGHDRLGRIEAPIISGALYEVDLAFDALGRQLPPAPYLSMPRLQAAQQPQPVQPEAAPLVPSNVVSAEVLEEKRRRQEIEAADQAFNTPDIDAGTYLDNITELANDAGGQMAEDARRKIDSSYSAAPVMEMDGYVKKAA